MQRVAVPGCLQFVQEVVQRWDTLLQPFVLAGLSYHMAGAAAIVKGVPRQDLPVFKHALGEGLATSVGSKSPVTSKDSLTGRYALTMNLGGTSHLELLKYMTMFPIQDTLDAAHHLLRTLDLNPIDS